MSSDGVAELDSPSTNEGALYVLRIVLQETPPIQGFEMDINGRRADFQMTQGAGGVYVDCKSWGLDSPTFNDFVGGEGNSYRQFLGYLGGVSSLNQLAYWFDAFKTPDVLAVRRRWQALFLASRTQSQIFNAIWNNVSLRNNLWNSTQYPNLQPQQAQQIFVTWLSNINHSIYNFIQVK